MIVVSPTYLSDFDGNRRNNFTVVRLVFAWAVLYGHSFAIHKIPGVSDPLNQLFQGSTWIGAVAVNGFFAISGFLVTASFVRRGLRDYAISRVLRIYPALIACVALSVFVLGPVMTSLDFKEYVFHSQTSDYLGNALAFKPMQWFLPGVFEGHANKAVNGSLWSLTPEVRCYLVLAVVGVLGVLKHKGLGSVLLLGLLIFGIFHFSDVPLFHEHPRWARPAMFFLLGVLLYLNRERVPLDHRLALLALFLVYVSFGQDWFAYVFPWSFVYLIFYYVYKTPYLGVDEKIGDLSYGTYIYAWPVQQTLTQAVGQMNPYINILLVSVITMALAYVSWHYLEKPTLSLKRMLLRTSMLTKGVSTTPGEEKVD